MVDEIKDKLNKLEEQIFICCGMDQLSMGKKIKNSELENFSRARSLCSEIILLSKKKGKYNIKEEIVALGKYIDMCVGYMLCGEIVCLDEIEYILNLRHEFVNKKEKINKLLDK